MPVSEQIKAFAPVQTWLPPCGLRDCIRAVMVRNTVGYEGSATSCWAHYPASPYCSINGLFAGEAHLLDVRRNALMGAHWQRLPAWTVSGPQTQPRTVFYERPMHGVMIVFYADAWHVLTGQSLTQWSDQVVDAHEVLPPELLDACHRMLSPAHDELRVQSFFDALQAIWLKCSSKKWHETWLAKDWAGAMTPWMESLAARAGATREGRSVRQFERRIKNWTGWSLRSLRGSVRGERVFFAAMEAAITEKRVNWVEIALDHGFTDQSHLIREVCRLTGFTPEALRHGILNEEAFWSYRAWAQLAGY